MRLLLTLSRLLITTVFVSAVSMATTFFIISSAAEQLLQRMGIPTEDAMSTLSLLVPQFIDRANETVKTDLSKDMPDDLSEDLSEDLPEEPPQDAMEVWRNLGWNTLISAEQFNQVQDAMSDEDKMKIFSILVTHIPYQEIHRLTSFLESGITPHELKQVYAIIEHHLDLEKFEQLAEIVYKYIGMDEIAE